MSIFHESFPLTPGFFPANEGTSAPLPCGLLIGIYLFYENWSTETFRKKESEKWAVCSTYKSLKHIAEEIDDYGLKAVTLAGKGKQVLMTAVQTGDERFEVYFSGRTAGI